jgi:hypothetical protein
VGDPVCRTDINVLCVHVCSVLCSAADVLGEVCRQTSTCGSRTQPLPGFQRRDPLPCSPYLGPPEVPAHPASSPGVPAASATRAAAAAHPHRAHAGRLPYLHLPGSSRGRGGSWTHRQQGSEAGQCAGAGGCGQGVGPWAAAGLCSAWLGVWPDSPADGFRYTGGPQGGLQAGVLFVGRGK